jgi:hypothetical protein
MRHAIVLLGALAAAAAAQSSSVEMAELSWLAGCWAREDAEPGSEEHWTTPAGGIMLGMSRTLRGGRVIEYEFLEIREMSPGRLGYVAHPSRQAEATFPLVRATRSEVVFENPEHDFPQRIIYRLVPPDRLVARIEGTRDGVPQGIDFRMKRSGCTK